MLIKSFFICEETRSILSHTFRAESDCTDASVLESWIPEFAFRAGFAYEDFIGGYVLQNHDELNPVEVYHCFSSIDVVNDYFETDCTDFKTNNGFDLNDVLAICSLENKLSCIVDY